nr:GNAT family N-acetyltransferase [Nocardiopsis mwathae]
MRFLRLLREIVPREPHGELVLLGVDPAAQRRGIGSALVRDGLDQADLAGYPVALVTTNSDDIAFYRRFDFKVCGELDRSGFPRAHCMWRDPAF